MDDKARIKQLESELAALQQKYDAPKVSPLAPQGGFPDLPVVKGVTFSAAAAGIKYQNRNDVMLMECAAGSSVAGVFTRSSTRSANVLDCQEKLKKQTQPDQSIAIIVNSGNSNAFTGRKGEGSVNAICAHVGEVMEISPDNVFTASTGVIGERLPHDRITAKVAELKANLSQENAKDAARAIMTTDTFAKGASQTISLNDKVVQIAGFAKGSGMIAPDMATMLVYIYTDAAIEQSVLQAMLSDLNNQSFNSITVDSDTSTSDSLMVAASGQSGAELIVDTTSEEAKIFKDALGKVMLNLAHQVVKDGEGATKFLEVTVKGAQSDESAKVIGLAIANSPLVKTAVAGEDPNWGRVVMGVGKSGEPADRDKLSIWFGDILVAENGWVSPEYHEDQGAEYMKQTDLAITADVGVGHGQATVWTCDLTHQYITINADYRS